MTRILIVEDSPTQANELLFILTSEKIEAEIAPHAESALDRLDSAQFDLVLSDVVMPGLSGYELCRKIKNDPRTKDLPVVLLTSLKDVTDIVHGLECGADNFITKPYERDYLLGRLKSILANKALQSERRIHVDFEMSLLGKKVTLSSDKQQMLDLLISTFEEYIRTKKREEAAKLTQEALRESQKLLVSTLDGLPSSIAVLDHSGKVVAVNAAWRQAANCNQLLGACQTGDNYLEACAADQCQEACSAVIVGIRQVIAKEQDSFFMEVALESEHQRCWLTVRATPVEGADPARVVMALEDITERKQTDDRLRRTEEQLQQAQKLEAVGSLAGGIAHEFNNLLQAIVGYAGYAIEGLPENGQRYRDLDQVLKAANRATTLTRQLLSFSRRQALQRTHLNPNEAVTELVKMLRPLIGENIELRTILADEAGLIYVDRGQFHQMLLNLCINARDAMPGGGQLVIRTEHVDLGESYCECHPGVRTGRHLRLTVADTGCGMTPDVKERIFEPFFTTKEVGVGTGLGLAMVYGMVLQHDGVIHVYSEPGAGTTFRIHLPIADGGATTSATRSIANVSGGTETILVAEDDPMVRDLIVRILSRAGYEIVVAHDGEEALRAFVENADRISLALLDLVMPKMGGNRLFQRLKELQPDLQVVFCSGHDPAMNQAELIVAQGMPLIQKPFDPTELLWTIRSVLDATPGMAAVQQRPVAIGPQSPASAPTFSADPSVTPLAT
jgi:signal transduction histidine kinase/DNA-binding response OmpR family regulator